MSDYVWNEYHDGIFFDSLSKFVSYHDNYGYLVLILKRSSDGIYVKLDESEAFWSESANNFRFFIANGFWKTNDESKNLKFVLG